MPQASSRVSIRERRRHVCWAPLNLRLPGFGNPTPELQSGIGGGGVSGVAL